MNILHTTNYHYLLIRLVDMLDIPADEDSTFTRKDRQ